MAVEARQLNLFTTRPITNRNFLSPNANDGIGSVCKISIPGSAEVNPSAHNKIEQSLLPFYQSAAGESFPAKASMKADSGLTYNNLPPSRKRARDAINQPEPPPYALNGPSHKSLLSDFSSFLGENFCAQMQQQQFEIDRLVAQHAEKVRLELSERRKRQARALAAAIEEAMAKKLREKEEEFERTRKINWVLQERVRALSVENQVWKELAQTNEATAISLRSNLEQVLAHVSDQERLSAGAGDAAAAAATAEDCVSSCGSCGGDDDDDYEGRQKRRRAAEEKAAGEWRRRRMCRKCGEGEAMVLLLPCRHLCLCTMCGSTLRTCPVCHASMTTSVHVNMSCDG